MGDGGDFSLFGGFEGAVDGGDGEAGEKADDGNHHQEFDEGKGGPAWSAGGAKWRGAGRKAEEQGFLMLDVGFWIHGRSRTFLSPAVKGTKLESGSCS